MLMAGWRDRRRTARRRMAVGDDVALVEDQLAAVERYLALPLLERTLANAVVAGAEEHAALLRVVLSLAGRAA